MNNIRDIKLSKYSEINYNACDKPGCERGKSHTKGNSNVALVYSICAIHDGIAHCQSRSMFGQYYDEYIPIENLEPYSKN